MKLLFFRILIGVVTFTIGVYLVFSEFRQTNQPDSPQKSHKTREFFQTTEIYSQNRLPLKTANSYIRFDDSDIVSKLNALVKYKQKTKKQTFHVFKDETSVFAYWKADSSIYQLNVIENENIDWFDDKARIDLKTEVVPTGKYGNLGCCLYEKDWIDAIIKKCLKGQKIIITP